MGNATVAVISHLIVFDHVMYFVIIYFGNISVFVACTSLLMDCILLTVIGKR